jgi:hypothetical protein
MTARDDLEQIPGVGKSIARELNADVHTILTRIIMNRLTLPVHT